jgi:hypothetical protein
MTRTTIITAAGAFMVLSFISACNRDQDQATPVGQQQGQGSAQDYPSTRNMEQPNPAIGGTNSATNKPAQLRGSVVPIAPFCVSKLVVSLPHDQLVQHRASCTGFSHGVRSNVSLVTS